VLQELRVLYDGTQDEDLRRQIAILESAFRQPGPRPAVRNELNRVRREGIAGEALLGALSSIYQLYGLDEVRTQRDVLGNEVDQSSNDELPRIVCSEALLS
jgi:hypothetical protein